MFSPDPAGPMSQLEREVMQTIQAPQAGAKPSKRREGQRPACPPGIAGVVLPELPRVRRTRPGVLRRGVGPLCWLYAGGVLAYWFLIHFTADRWWLGTILMYSPRWLAATPLCVLAPLALLLNRRSLAVLAGMGLLVAGPIMDFRIPAPWATSARAAQLRVRILNLNTDGADLDAKALGELIRETKPDIVALQDWRGRHEEEVFGKGDWNIRRDGELLVASRFPIDPGVTSSDQCWRMRNGHLRVYQVHTPKTDIRLANLHLATARHALEAIIHGGTEGAPQIMENVQLRAEQSQSAAEFIRSGSPRQPILIAGDFNTLTDSVTYRRYWSSFTNAFSTAGLGWGFTHFTHRTALRIDHVLTGPGWRVTRAWVGPAVGSAHRPVLADLEWSSAGE
jgi:vancomycin resistance protein VanJ